MKFFNNCVRIRFCDNITKCLMNSFVFLPYLIRVFKSFIFIQKTSNKGSKISRHSLAKVQLCKLFYKKSSFLYHFTP